MKNVPLMLVSSALLAFGAGAVQAQTTQSPAQPSQQQPQNQAPQQQQQQPQQQQQQQQQQQMPAPKPASADQVSQCNKIASSVMSSLKSSDFDGATSTFDEQLKPMLPASKLKEGWKSLTDKYGQPKSIGNANEGQQVQDYTVVLLPMQFEKAEMGAQVACSAKGKVASLRIGVMQDDSQDGGGASSKS